MLKAPLSQEEYLRDPNRCPACGSKHLSGDEVTIDNGAAYQRIGCIECSAEWTDRYKLVRYELD